MLTQQLLPRLWKDLASCNLSFFLPSAAGFDASYMDPLGHMMLGSEDYRYFTAALQQHAATSPHCQVSCLCTRRALPVLHIWHLCLLGELGNGAGATAEELRCRSYLCQLTGTPHAF